MAHMVIRRHHESVYSSTHMCDASILHAVLVKRRMDGPNPQPLSNHSGNIVLNEEGETSKRGWDVCGLAQQNCSSGMQER